MATILIADDASAVLDVLYEVLSQEGHAVHTASTGSEALKRFREIRPELVVLDIVMPDMDGLVVLDSIRQIDAHVPVVLITGLTSESLAQKVARDPAVSFFQKGSGLDQFIGLVSQRLAAAPRSHP